VWRGGRTLQSRQRQQIQISDKDAPMQSLSNRLQLHCFLFKSVSNKTRLGRCIFVTWVRGLYRFHASHWPRTIRSKKWPMFLSWSNSLLCFYYRPYKLIKLYSAGCRWISVKHFWNYTDRGKPKYPDINLSQYSFFLYRCHVDWLWVALQPPQQ
jgi:hypothetical protein